MLACTLASHPTAREMVKATLSIWTSNVIGTYSLMLCFLIIKEPFFARYLRFSFVLRPLSLSLSHSLWKSLKSLIFQSKAICQMPHSIADIYQKLVPFCKQIRNTVKWDFLTCFQTLCFYAMLFSLFKAIFASIMRAYFAILMHLLLHIKSIKI